MEKIFKYIDKIVHFSLSALGVICFFILFSIFTSDLTSKILSAVVIFLLGVIKELFIDVRGDKWDIAANILGIAMGILIIELL